MIYNLGEETDSGDEEDYWQAPNKQGDKVQVFFTRNGKVIGKKDVFVPRGGFYPTVGMMSSQEKVRVELRPLSGWISAFKLEDLQGVSAMNKNFFKRNLTRELWLEFLPCS